MTIQGASVELVVTIYEKDRPLTPEEAVRQAVTWISKNVPGWHQTNREMERLSENEISISYMKFLA